MNNGKFFTTLSLDKSRTYYTGITSCESLKIKITDNGRKVRPSKINWSIKNYHYFCTIFWAQSKNTWTRVCFSYLRNLLLFFFLHNLTMLNNYALVLPAHNQALILSLLRQSLSLNIIYLWKHLCKLQSKVQFPCK